MENAYVTVKHVSLIFLNTVLKLQFAQFMFLVRQTIQTTLQT